jgi:hypothetical protein
MECLFDCLNSLRFKKQSKHPYNHGLNLKNVAIRQDAATFTHYLD